MQDQCQGQVRSSVFSNRAKVFGSWGRIFSRLALATSGLMVGLPVFCIPPGWLLRRSAAFAACDRLRIWWRRRPGLSGAAMTALTEFYHGA